MRTPRTAQVGAVCYGLWGLLHIAGGLLQISTLRQGGGGALTALISSATAADPAVDVPTATAAFMGMGAANIVVVGALVLAMSFRTWRNDGVAYWTNLLVAGGLDLTLVGFLLAPGIMAWADGLIGLALFIPAAILTTVARFAAEGPRAPLAAHPVRA